MRYVLGIHLGGTRVTAAVCRYHRGHWGEAEIVPLTASAPWTESVLHVSTDGDLLVGQAAAQLAATEPERVARAPLRRTGDPVPFVLGGVSYPAETLAAGMIGWVTDRVAEIEVAQAERIVVTHPPNWSAYRRGLLHEALDQAALPGVLALPSPIAAAESHVNGQGNGPGNGTAAAGSETAGSANGTGTSGAEIPGTVAIGKVLGICVLGGAGTQAALLRRGPNGFELLAHAESDGQDAGAHLDDLLVDHLLPRVRVDENDLPAMAWLRASCAGAKEQLSYTAEVPVTDSVSVSREEFEELARPALTTALSRLRRLVWKVPADDLAGAVLVGGSARIPLVGELARTMLSIPVTIDDDPGSALCRGAALAARPRPAPPDVGDHEPVPAGHAPASSMERGRAESPSLITGAEELPAVYGYDDNDQDQEQEPPPQRPPIEITPLEPPRRRFSFTRKGTSSGNRDEER